MRNEVFANVLPGSRDRKGSTPTLYLSPRDSRVCANNLFLGGPIELSDLIWLKSLFKPRRNERSCQHCAFTRRVTRSLGLRRIRADHDVGVRWSTISKDCTGGVQEKQSSLLREYGKRLRNSTYPTSTAIGSARTKSPVKQWRDIPTCRHISDTDDDGFDQLLDTLIKGVKAAMNKGD